MVILLIDLIVQIACWKRTMANFGFQIQTALTKIQIRIQLSTSLYHSHESYYY
jgi:hypothetical protein